MKGGTLFIVKGGTLFIVKGGTLFIVKGGTLFIVNVFVESKRLKITNRITRKEKKGVK